MAASEGSEKKKEGSDLLGSPTFKELSNGRFKCVQTGHELLAKDKDLYSQSKRCRLGLIDYALSRNKSPLNMFKPDPSSRSKLICKLTGDRVNKSEEHLWKHMTGKRFLSKLEEMEAKDLTPDTMVQSEPNKGNDFVKNKNKKKKKKKKNKDKDKEVEEIESESEVRECSGEESEPEDVDFWRPPKGERWDFDDGGVRWGSDSESESESGRENGDVDEEDDGIDDENKDDGKVSEELSVRTKRMSIEIGPSSFASRKKKLKKNKIEC